VGGNTKLKTRAESPDWKLNIMFEFTLRDTPQQNHLAELGFAVMVNRRQTLVHHTNVPWIILHKVWQEAFKMVTLLDGLMPIEIDGVVNTSYVHWDGANPPSLAKHLKTWGEAGMVKLKIKAMLHVSRNQGDSFKNTRMAGSLQTLDEVKGHQDRRSASIRRKTHVYPQRA
jgi:hypothetical protein